jgi:hypothetical protein
MSFLARSKNETFSEQTLFAVTKMSAQEQKARKDKIYALVKAYNAEQKKLNPKETHQLIVDTHVYGCCCGTCWYDFGGKDRPAGQAAHSVYADIANMETRFYKD